jgi:hypothetical protein
MSESNFSRRLSMTRIWIRAHVGLAPWIRIRIEVKSWVLIRIRTCIETNADPKHR